MWTLRCIATNTWLVVLLCQLILCCHHGTARHPVRPVPAIDTDKSDTPLLPVTSNGLEESSSSSSLLNNATEMRPKRQLGKRPNEHAQKLCGFNLYSFVKLMVCRRKLFSGGKPNILAPKVSRRKRDNREFMPQDFFPSQADILIRRRLARSPMDKCCSEGCTITELKAYCDLTAEDGEAMRFEEFEKPTTTTTEAPKLPERMWSPKNLLVNNRLNSALTSFMEKTVVQCLNDVKCHAVQILKHKKHGLKIRRRKRAFLCHLARWHKRCKRQFLFVKKEKDPNLMDMLVRMAYCVLGFGGCKEDAAANVITPRASSNVPNKARVVETRREPLPPMARIGGPEKYLVNPRFTGAGELAQNNLRNNFHRKHHVNHHNFAPPQVTLIDDDFGGDPESDERKRKPFLSDGVDVIGEIPKEADPNYVNFPLENPRFVPFQTVG